MTKRDAQIIARYLANVPTFEMVREFGISRQRIDQILVQHRIPRRPRVVERSPTQTALLIEACKGEIIDSYKTQSAHTVGEQIGISGATITRYLREWGVTIRDVRVPQERLARWISMYLDDEMSTKEIGEREGYAQSGVHRTLVDNGVPMRTPMEAVRLGIKRRRIKIKVYGWRSFRTECKTHHQQTREIVACTSMRQAALLAGEKYPQQLSDLCETGNEQEIVQAMSEPGTVFWSPIDARPARWTCVPPAVPPT